MKQTQQNPTKTPQSKQQQQQLTKQAPTWQLTDGGPTMHQMERY